MQEKYYERGVFIDEGPFVIIRLWRGGVMARNFGLLKPRGVRRHDESIEVEYADHPASAKVAADRWSSIVETVEINP